MRLARDVSDLKLCLEILSRCGIYPDLQQLALFLADESHQKLLEKQVLPIKEAWQRFAANDDEEELAKLCGNAETSLPISLTLTVEESKTDTGLTEVTEELDPTEKQTESDMINPFPQPPANPRIRFKLPNAMVGKAYHEEVSWESAALVNVVKVSGLQAIGLNYDSASNTVSGEPLTAGDHTLVITYQPFNEPESVYTAELNLVINNNPKSLWKDIPSDQNVLFWKADSDYQGMEGLYHWKIAAASKRGRSHAHVGSCRDDDFAIHVDEKSVWQVTAVTDGAGSSQYSREGAKIIAHRSVEVLTQQLNESNTTLDELIGNWRQDKSLGTEIALHEDLVKIFQVVLASCVEAIEAMAQQQQARYRDFYSTLLIAAHKTLPDSEFVISYWIGDGGLALFNAGQSVDLLGESDSGEYAGQTRFLDRNALDEDDLSKRVIFSMSKNFTALLLMTDGISDPLFESDNNLHSLEYWDSLWQQISPLLSDNPEISARQFTDWLDFWSPGNHDDRTLVVVYR